MRASKWMTTAVLLLSLSAMAQTSQPAQNWQSAPAPQAQLTAAPVQNGGTATQAASETAPTSAAPATSASTAPAQPAPAQPQPSQAAPSPRDQVLDWFIQPGQCLTELLTA